MSTSMIAAPAATSTPTRYGIALAVIVAGQTMILIDEMIVNIALPGMSAELSLSPVALSWVINAYLLTFGGLLLLGGRTGDILGRRRVFLAGIALFSLASLGRGLASEGWMLIAARAVQGVGAALATPSVLALIMSMFAEGPRRKRAIAVYTAVGGLGAALGLLLAGTLTSASSWRWVLMLNVPIGLLVLLSTPFVIRETEPNPGRFDLGGALSSTLGVAALVLALSAAGSEGWFSPMVQGAVAVGVVLLATFVVIEGRARQPIVVPRLFADRDRVCAYLAVLLVQGSQIGQLFFLTQFFQQGLGFSPLTAALAFLPVTVTLLPFAAAVVKLEPKVGARPLIVLGAAMLVGSNLLLSRLDLDTHYIPDVLPALLLLGAGIALGTIPATILGTSGVDTDETGSASSVINATTTLGASLALAVLITVMTAASTNAATSAPAELPQEAVDGYVFLRGMSASFLAGAVFALATLIVALFIRRQPTLAPDDVIAQPTRH